MRRLLAFHPVLFALWIIFHWANQNVFYVIPEMVLVPALVAAAAAAVLLLVLRILLKNTVKAAVISSACIVWFLSYEFFVDSFDKLIHARSSDESGATFLYLLAWFSSIFALSRIRSYSPEINTVLTVVSSALVLLNAVPYAAYQYQMTPIYNYIAEAPAQEDASAKLQAKAGLPDIYYIILDGMGRSDVFKRGYRYDNTPFIDSLKQRGFFVGSRSRANYAWTALSLGSSLNMEYLNGILSKFDGKIDGECLERMVQFSRVERLLKTMGYRYVYCGSLTEVMPSADVNIDTGWATWFGLMVLENTAVNILPERWDPVAAAVRQKRTWLFRNAEKVASIPGPKFVFAHVLLPHNPYLFHKDGSPLFHRHFSHVTDWEDRRQYIDQAQFVENQISMVVDTLLKDKRQQPIIILQGDHGPLCGAVKGEDAPSYLNERMPILNAYFLPGGGREALYDGISPVNSFRVIFNYYFGGNFPLLADKSNSSHFLKQLDLHDVTGIVESGP